MPKLLQINTTVNWGSTGKIAEQIGQKAISAGWECYMAYGRYCNPSKLQLIKVGNKLSILWHYVESRFFDNEGLSSKAATKKFLKAIEIINPDIIHLHNIHDHWINYKILFEYLSEKKVPVVWTMHDQWVISGHCMNHPNDCDHWKEGCIHCPMINRKYPKVIIKRAKRNFILKTKYVGGLDKLNIVAVSDWSGTQISTSYLANKSISILYNGIDINAFNIQETIPLNIVPFFGKKIILGVSSKWTAEKGLVDFYSLALNLEPDNNIIILVGKIKSKGEKQIKGGCQIVYIDRTQDVTELAQYYSAADVFVNPTYYDNFPSTNLEALACGTPVITYDTGGSPEAIDEKTGKVVPQGDVEVLATTVNEFLNGDFKGKHYADCRQRAERLYDKDKCFDRYIQLYNKLLKNKT